MDPVTTVVETATTPGFTEWLKGIAAAVGFIVMAASAIVPLTSTPKDDEILGKLKGFLQRFSIFNPKP